MSEGKSSEGERDGNDFWLEADDKTEKRISFNEIPWENHKILHTVFCLPLVSFCPYEPRKWQHKNGSFNQMVKSRGVRSLEKPKSSEENTKSFAYFHK
jgi:hypothetical protein